MDDFKEKSNNELFALLNELKIEHEAIKQKMLQDYDRLLETEKKFYQINDLLKKRLGHVK